MAYWQSHSARAASLHVHVGSSVLMLQTWELFQIRLQKLKPRPQCPEISPRCHQGPILRTRAPSVPVLYYVGTVCSPLRPATPALSLPCWIRGQVFSGRGLGTGSCTGRGWGSHAGPCLFPHTGNASKILMLIVIGIMSVLAAEDFLS